MVRILPLLLKRTNPRGVAWTLHIEVPTQTCCVTPLFILRYPSFQQHCDIIVEATNVVCML
jgi:hypothetical protein